MNTTTTGAGNLILRIVGSENPTSLIPVKSDSCVLAESNADQSGRFECCIKRDEQGAFVRSFNGPVTINGNPPQARQRLSEGDQICVGRNTYQIYQVGSWAPEVEKAQEDFVSKNEIDSVNSRIKKIESELGLQTASFERIHKRFEDLGQQMDQLLDAIGSPSESQPAVAQQIPAEIQNAETVSSVVGPQEQAITEVIADPTPSPPSVEAQPQPAAELPEESDNKERQQLEATFSEYEDTATPEDSTAEAKPSSQDAEARLPEEASPVVTTPQELNSAQELTPSQGDTTESAIDENLDSLQQYGDEIVAEPLDQMRPSNDTEPVETEEENLLARLNALTGGADRSNENAEATETAEATVTLEATGATPELPVAESQPALDTQVELTSEPVESVEQSHSSNDEDKDSLQSLLASLGSATPQTPAEANEREPQVDSELSFDGQQAIPAQESSPQVSSPDLENLFTSLRESDQHTFDESNVSDEQASQPIKSDHLNELDQQLDSYREDTQVSEMPVEESSVVDIQVEESPIEVPQQASLETADLTPHETSTPEQDFEALQESAAQSLIADDEPPQQESVAELLARMQAMPDLSDEPASESPVEPVEPVASHEQEPVAASPVHSSAPEADAPDGGADVQDYMNSLLQRLNTGQPAESEAAIAAPEPQESKAEVVDAPGEFAAEVAVEPVMAAEEFKPKRVAPETNSNLAAMRELANATSRSAVKRSAQKRKKQDGNAMLLAAGGAVAGAVTCSMLKQAPNDIFHLLSIGLFLVTIVCSVLYVKNNLLAASGNSNNSGKEDSAPSKGSVFSKLFKKKATENPEEDS